MENLISNGRYIQRQFGFQRKKTVLICFDPTLTDFDKNQNGLIYLCSAQMYNLSKYFIKHE